jgi:hypothetical protein
VRRGVFRHQKKDGTVIHVEISEDRIVFDGKPAGLVVAVDVSERLKLEQQLLQIQRLRPLRWLGRTKFLTGRLQASLDVVKAIFQLERNGALFSVESEVCPKRS